MSSLAYDLVTTIHSPERTSGVREFEIRGHVYMASGQQFHWDDGQTYTVERTLFVMEKHSALGDPGLHVYLS